MGMMYRSGMSKMGDYYAAGQKMNNTIVEYINGMEVVKGLQPGRGVLPALRAGCAGLPGLHPGLVQSLLALDGLYNSILPCVALFTLPIGAYLVLRGYSTLPDFALVLCMSFGVGAPLLRAHRRGCVRQADCPGGGHRPF